MHASCEVYASTQAMYMQVLNINEFSSARKCMSMVVETPEGTIELYCKGADDVMFQRVQSTEKEIEEMKRHLKFFGVYGLRTLVFAKVIVLTFSIIILADLAAAFLMILDDPYEVILRGLE